MKKILLGTAIALAASSAAFAQDYQFEVGLGYHDGDLEDADYDGYSLNAEFHLERVDTSKGPLNEAAFADKSSSVGVAWRTSEFDDTSIDRDVVGIDGRFVTKDDLIIEAAYEDTDFDVVGEETTIKLGVGTYINDHMDVVVSYEDYDEADRFDLAVDSHGLNHLQGDTALAYDLGLSYVDEDDDSGYALRAGADYYFNKALSLGAGVELESVDDDDISIIDVRAKYFVTPVVALGLSYVTLGQDADGDELGLTAAMRF